MIRAYRQSDQKMVYRLFREEGIEPSETDFKQGLKWVYMLNGHSVGFFITRTVHELPFLAHFCIDRKYRNINTARELIKEFAIKVKELGYTQAIVHASEGQVGVQKLLCHYFRKPFYAKSEGTRFMLVEV